MTVLAKSAAVSDTSANSQQATYLLDTYSCSLFTDSSHIQLHIEIWEVGVRSNLIKVLLICSQYFIVRHNVPVARLSSIISLTSFDHRLFVVVDTFIRFTISREDRIEA